jgi:hypothetical protein
MTIQHTRVVGPLLEQEWVSFQGGELEGRRPKTLCPACRQALTRAASARMSRVLCFECYRADLDRERALRAAGQLDTASDARFQGQLPFEPVNRARLGMLKAQRSEARAAGAQGIGRYVDKRRHAQIEARHVLQQVVAGLSARQLAAADRDQLMASAIHAAELQLPEAWLPFVVSRGDAVGHDVSRRDGLGTAASRRDVPRTDMPQADASRKDASRKEVRY